MTDLELVRLCAEAMGYVVPMTRNLGDKLMVPQGSDFVRYTPLHDDAQAMALVKKFRISIGAPFPNTPQWECQINDRIKGCAINKTYACATNDLNLAICLCVAKMQAAK